MRTISAQTGYSFSEIRWCLLLLLAFIQQQAFGATFTVTNLNDSGLGSLRDSIEAANAASGPDTVEISVSGTIELLSTIDLDDATGGTVIIPIAGDVTLDGSVGNPLAGLALKSNNNLIRGLTIINMGSIGIRLLSASFNAVEGCRLGNDGTTAFPNGYCGISIEDASTNNTIGGGTPTQRNIISGNVDYGVVIIDAGANLNSIVGNYIGLNSSGDSALGNGLSGVLILRAPNNAVGKPTGGEGNIISGNVGEGVTVSGTGSTGNTIEGNIIGLDASASIAIPNGTSGVYIYAGAQSNRVGGEVSGAANIIAGNLGPGIYLVGLDTDNNFIKGNLIGLASSGSLGLGNGGDGIYMTTDVSNTTVGGTSLLARNVISNNGGNGVVIESPNSTGNTLVNNFIGTSIDGTSDVGNAGDGIFLHLGATSNTIGGDAADEGNLISGNNQNGIRIAELGTDANVVIGNKIGTSVDGVGAIPNSDNGVLIESGSSNNFIGGLTAGEGNIIAFNGIAGVSVNQSSSANNRIRANSIHSNSTDGILLANGGNPTAATPIISSLVPITGNAIANGEIDFFADSLAQGRIYLGSATADGSGSYTTAIDLTVFEGQNLTATATTAAGDTSTFSAEKGIDVTPPMVASITLMQPTPTTELELGFRVEFSENVTGVDPEDFSVDLSNFPTAFVWEVSGSGTTYFVLVLRGEGEGQLGLDLVDNDSIVDDSGNVLGGPGLINGDFSSTVSYLIVPRPTVTLSTATPLVTNHTTIRVAVAFSAEVTGFDLGDISADGGFADNLIGSGADYVFELTPYEPGIVSVFVEDAAAIDQFGNPTVVSVTLSRTYDNLVETGQLVGAVKELIGKSAIGNAAIRLTRDTDNLSRLFVADLNGRFRAIDLASGLYTMKVVAVGFAPKTVPIAIEANTSRSIVVGLAPRNPLGGVGGVITDQTSSFPLVGVTIEARIGDVLLDTTFSGADGSYEFADLAKGQKANVMLSFDAPGYESEIADVEVIPGATEQEPIEMSKSAGGIAQVAGLILRDANGEPINNARVTVTGVIGFTVVSNGSGVYAVPGLPFGDYTFEASAEGFTGQYALRTLESMNIEPLDFYLDGGQPIDILTDIDGDGTLNAVDVQLVINAALSLYVLGNADVDLSGDIDATDVQLVVNAALAK